MSKRYELCVEEIKINCKISFHTHKTVKVKFLAIPRIPKDVRKRKFSNIAGGRENRHFSVESTLQCLVKKEQLPAVQ